MDTHTNTNTEARTYKGGSLNRVQSQWVAEWLRTLGIDLPAGWTAVWKMNAKQVSTKYKVSLDEVIAAANGEKR